MDNGLFAYDFILALMMLFAATLIGFFVFHVRRLHLYHYKRRGMILKNRPLMDLDLEEQADQTILRSYLDSERNEWTTWHALTGTLLTALGFLAALFGLFYGQRATTEQRQYEKTEALYATFQDAMTHSTDWRGLVAISKTSSKAQLKSVIELAEKNTKAPYYAQVMAAKAFLNDLERISDQYNQNLVKREDVRKSYGPAIRQCWEESSAIVEAFRELHPIKVGEEAYWEPIQVAVRSFPSS